jgi:type IV secretory pathway TraG/TraD family ATPase VirD4
MNNSDYQQELALIHQLQTHTFSVGHAYLLILFGLPLPIHLKLAIYHFFTTLPLPQLSPTQTTVLILVGPILFLIFMYFAVKLIIAIVRTLIPFALTKFKKTKEEKIFLELTFPADTSKSAYATEQLYKTIHTVAGRNKGFFSAKKTFSLEIVSSRNDGIRYVIGVPPADADVMHRTLLSYLPGLSIREIPDYLESMLVVEENEDAKQATEKSLGFVQFTLSDDFVLPLENQKVLGKHDSIAFLTGNMTKLEKGELVAFQIVTSPTVSSKVREHMLRVKNTIYQGKPLTPALFKKSTLPLPPALILILGPVVWLTVSLVKLLIAMPHLILDPKGPHAKYFFDSSSKSQLQAILNPYEMELSTVVKGKLSEQLFETSIRLLIMTNTEEESDARQTGLVSSFSQFTSQYQSLKQQEMTPLPFLANHIFKERFEDFQKRNLSDDNLILSSSEISDLYHFPNMDITKIEGLVKSKSSELPAPRSIKRDDGDLDVIVGKNTYGGEETAVGLRKKDRYQHTYIVGKTGMGKSTIIEGMALQDIKSGKGICVIDPHGDMVEHLLTLIPKDRQRDVVYVNPFDKEFPTGLNILNPGTNDEDLEEEHRRIAQTVMSIFMKITPERHWGQRMEHVLRNAILTTLLIQADTANTPYISLYTIQKLLTDDQYRKSVTTTLSDPILKQFWEKEFMLFRKGQQGDIVAPLTNKIGEFITDPLSRYILLQKNSTINISEIMDNSKILLVNLSNGKLGEERSAFFGTIITSLIQLATYQRAQTEEKKRRDFFVYIDEFQNFATPHFTELFSEARKYHVYFTPSHQNIAQIDDPKVSKVIKGNSGNFIALKGSSDDEEAMLPIFSPEVEKGQIVNLAPFHFFMKVTNDESEDAFTGVTIPVQSSGSKETKEAIIKHSRLHYATKREDVEKQLEQLLQVVPKVQKRVLKNTRIKKKRLA